MMRFNDPLTDDALLFLASQEEARRTAETQRRMADDSARIMQEQQLREAMRLNEQALLMQTLLDRNGL